MAAFRRHKKPIHLDDDHPWSAEHRLYPTLMAVAAAVISIVVLVIRLRDEPPGKPKPKGVDVINYTAPAAPTPAPTPAPACPAGIARSEPRGVLSAPPDKEPSSKSPSGAHLLARKERALETATERIRQAIERGHRHCLDKQVLVEAHFALGTNQWSIRSATALGSRAPSTSATLRLWTDAPWPNERPEGDWRFLSFSSLEGHNTGPMLVFFPGGYTQGGKIELGWIDGPRRILQIDESSRVTDRLVKTANLEAPK